MASHNVKLTASEKAHTCPTSAGGDCDHPTREVQHVIKGEQPRHPHRHGTTSPELFEERTYAMAKGAETPDGPLEGLALHHDHGKEGHGSKAEHQIDDIVHHHQHQQAATRRA